MILNGLQLFNPIQFLESSQGILHNISFAFLVKELIEDCLVGGGVQYAHCIFCIGVRPKKIMVYPGYDTKEHLIMRFQFWRSGEWKAPFQCHHHPDHSDPSVVVPVTVLSMVQMDFLKIPIH